MRLRAKYDSADSSMPPDATAIRSRLASRCERIWTSVPSSRTDSTSSGASPVREASSSVMPAPRVGPVRGPIDDNYWAWMSMVGLIHVIRRVTNPMMLSMTDFVAGYVSNNAHRLNLDPDEQRRLVDALRRLAGMTGSVITWGYDHAVSAALFEVAGMPEALLARLRDAEIKTALVDAREEVGNG